MHPGTDYAPCFWKHANSWRPSTLNTCINTSPARMPGPGSRRPQNGMPRYGMAMRHMHHTILRTRTGLGPSRHNWVHINNGHTHGAAEKPPYIAPMGQQVRDGGWPSREDCRGLTPPTNTGTLDQSGLCAAGRQQRLDYFPLTASGNNTQLHANITSP